MDKIDRIIARMWADAAHQSNQSNQSDTETDLTSTDASTKPDTGRSPGTTKGQCTNIEERLKGRGAEVAKPAAKQLSLQARRRMASQHSAKSCNTLSTNRHQSRRHQSTV